MTGTLTEQTEILVIEGQHRLSGEVEISGAKNSALKLMAAAILTPYPVTLHNVPKLSDVAVMADVIRHLGVEVIQDGNSMHINAKNIITTEAPYELVSKMRASFLVLGALLARCGEARVAMPGGCSIGKRGIDLHIKGLKRLGADVITDQGYVEAKSSHLVGREILLDMPSVGATENIMLAAVFAEGTTIICNAAEEPEIQDLANFVNAIGGEIYGAGTSEITINGVDPAKMRGTEFTVVPDRIEAATYMVAAVATQGDVTLKNIVPNHLLSVIRKLDEMGANIERLGPNSLRVHFSGHVKPQNLITQPYPGFPTDNQALFMSLLSVADGASIINETLYENRFKMIGELCRMGAHIKQEGNVAAITGVKSLTGTQVKASDLRAGAGLIVAGLMAEGRTELYDIHHIDRGYENVVAKFQSLGAVISRVKMDTYQPPTLSETGR